MAFTIRGARNADGTPNANSGMIEVIWSWTSSGGGTVSEAMSETLTGLLLGVETDPDGSAVPTANYGLTVTNARGRDVLGGAGASRSDSATEYIQPKDTAGNACIMPLIGDTLTFAIASAGAAKQGVARLFIEKR